MPRKDHHEKPFSQETLAKLEIFEDYAKAWIPTFVMQGCKAICIFDFFAGPGKDSNGVYGSPLRILEQVRKYIKHILLNKVEVRIFFNELDREKFEALQSSCSNYLEQHSELKKVVTIQYFNKDFDELFNELFSVINSFPSLVYLDQNGVKYVAYIPRLEKASRTDFLYFVSSSFIWRFGDRDEFKSCLPIDMSDLKSQPFKDIHRTLVAKIRESLSPDTKLRLYPFSIKKESNIYGIIFGASHIRAVDKFLSIAWNRNETNGEANFDIDDDHQKGQLNIFESRSLTKIEAFQALVRRKVLDGEIINNLELFVFTLQEGHLAKHADECLRRMRKDGEIDYDAKSPLLTYKHYKSGRKLEYRKLRK